MERQYGGKALLITACGFPDVQTRMLLNRLHTEYPALPIYGIADWDPYGARVCRSVFGFGFWLRGWSVRLRVIALGVVG